MKLAKRIFWGIFFLLAAAVIALQTFGVFSIGVNIGILLLIILLAAIIIASLAKFFWFGVFMPAAWIIVLLSQSAVLPAMSGEQTGITFAIAGLVSIGFHILFHTRGTLFIHASKDGTEANFGSAVKYFNEEPFENADLECNFGNVKAYFTDAKLKHKTASIHVECNFGSIELFIPKNWRIEQNVDNSFASVDYKGSASLTDASPTVSLTGECNFGSVTVIYT